MSEDIYNWENEENPSPTDSELIQDTNRRVRELEKSLYAMMEKASIVLDQAEPTMAKIMAHPMIKMLGVGR